MTDRTRISAIAWRCRGVLDPADNLEQVQERSCHDCKQNEKQEFMGAVKWVCRIGRRKKAAEISETQRCEKYQTAGKP